MRGIHKRRTLDRDRRLGEESGSPVRLAPSLLKLKFALRNPVDTRMDIFHSS